MSKLTTATATSTIATRYEAGTTDRTALIMGLVSDGYSLNMATNGYSAYAKDAGLTATIVSHKAEALADLAEYDADTWTAETVRNEVIILADRYNVAESTARDYCKAYSDELGVAHPVANPREAIFQWFKDAGDTADHAEFIEYATVELGRSKSNANEYWKGYELHLFLVG